jgi:ribosomal protein S18 acetylase RimI-like enzyme
LGALEQLERLVFSGDRLSTRSIRSFIAAGDRMLVASVAEELAGYALVIRRKGSRTARLYSIAVDPARAGRGVGRALLAAVQAHAIERGCDLMRLEVREDNRRAIALYEKLGYRPFGRHEDYYDDGSPALRLEKRLVAS